MTFSKFQFPLVIRESHLDTFGHVNNATYLQILEEARWEFITRNGFGYKEIQRNLMGPVILEINMKFLKELRLREQIIIDSQTLSYEGKIGNLRQTILNAAGEVCFEAKMVFGLFDLKQRKLIEPTPEWLKAVGVH